MRILLAAFSLCACLAYAQQPDLTGSWTFTWDGDPKNANPADLKQGAGTLSGTYVNDAKDKCPIAGRMTSPTGIALTIACPKWEIRAEGSIKGVNAVAGNYAAYGSSKGTFQMSRK
jgi:hypothetical protein